MKDRGILERMTGKAPAVEVLSAIRRLSVMAGMAPPSTRDVMAGKRTLAQAVDAMQRRLDAMEREA